jgi:hypothetical protein
MVYRYGQRIKRDRKSIKKYIIGATASIMMLFGAAIPALADSSGYCGSSATGCAAASAAGAQCGSGAASGAFGAFGTFNSGTHDWRGGANGPATGASNSAVCGNPQGNP